MPFVFNHRNGHRAGSDTFLCHQISHCMMVISDIILNHILTIKQYLSNGFRIQATNSVGVSQVSVNLDHIVTSKTWRLNYSAYQQLVVFNEMLASHVSFNYGLNLSLGVRSA